MTERRRPHLPVSLVVPVKRLDRAKSRLDMPAPARASIALRLMAHSVGVAAATPTVGLVVVVTDDDVVASAARHLGAIVAEEPRSGGLNGAAQAGRSLARELRPDQDIGVMVSDLPELTTPDLMAALDEYARSGSPMLVRDSVGTGTTLLVHPSSTEPPILFGQNSATAHRMVGYTAARGALPGLRRDLDTVAELRDALKRRTCGCLASMAGVITRP